MYPPVVPVKWRLNQKIKEEFDAQGIVIPYNQTAISTANTAI